jgi:hypothetical protein
MKTNNLKFLIIIFTLLLIGAAGLFVYDKNQQAVDTTAKTGNKDVFSSLNMDGLNKITLKNKDKSVELTIQDNVWKVNGKNADQAQVAAMIDALKNTKTYDLVSKNPENHKQMGVDAEEGTEVTVEQGSGKISVIVGNPAGTGNAFFLRKQGENDVYLSRGALSTLKSTEVNSWRDKKIAQAAFDKLAKVEVTGNKTITISKNVQGKWIKNQQRTDKELSEENVSNLSTVFSPLEAFAFANEEETKSFNNSREKMTVKLLDNENKEIAKFETAKVADNYVVKLGNESDLLKVYGSKIGFIFE